MPVTVHPGSPASGAEIRGVDTSKPFDAQTMAQVRNFEMPVTISSPAAYHAKANGPLWKAPPRPCSARLPPYSG